MAEQIRGKRRQHRRYNAKGRRPDLYKERCQIAAENLERWRALTPRQQLDALDSRLGVGVGAKKQRARLQKKVAP